MATSPEPSPSLFDKDPGFLEAQSTYAQYPQYAQDQKHEPPRQPTFAKASPSSRTQDAAAKSPGWWDTGFVDIVRRRWPRTFLLLAFLQAVICIALETYTFSQFHGSPKHEPSSGTDFKPKLETIPTFFTLFIFGFVCHVVLTWDALRLKNIIQIAGLCITNLALLAYAIIQVGQIKDAVGDLVTEGIIQTQNIWDDIQPVFIAIACVMGILSLLMGFNAWKLLQEFAWDIMKHMGADYRMKKRFLHYQVYITFLKFDFLFFLGFTIQFLVVVRGSYDVEYHLTILTIPLTVAVLLAAAWSVKKEFKTGMVLVVLFYTAGLGYFIFKMQRIYDPLHSALYMPVRTSLTVFASLTVVLIVLTILNSVVCMLDFGAGLKQHLSSAPRGQNSQFSMDCMDKDTGSRRMTID